MPQPVLIGDGRVNVPNTLAACLLLIVVGLPIAAGVAACVAEAFGITPGLAGGGAGFDAWTGLLAWPGLATSLSLTLRTGLIAAALSVASALLIGLAAPGWARRGAGPLLAAPHAAMAIGLLFLVSPTGWLVRLAGIEPPEFATIGDRFGTAIILALWVKETPFLLLAVLAALGQADAARSRLVAASLGYAPGRAALFAVLPRIWPQLRLPVMAVLAFSLSVTDVALVLGPQTPPTLAVQILRWSSDPDLSRWTWAAAASLLLLGLVLGSFAALRGVETIAAGIGRRLARRGARGRASPDVAAACVAGLVGLVGFAALATLVLWAGALSWRFPAAWPQDWSPTLVALRLAGLAEPAVTTLWLGLASTAASLVVAIAALAGGASLRIAWLPLLLPQAGFLFGVQTVLVLARLDGSAAALVWAHLLFVLPYVLVALQGPWHALDRRHARAAASLGASPWRVLWRIRLPLLAGPLLAAAGVGFAVSVALYLPTVFAGAGRVDTLATLAVSLASGSDRRLLAATALAQAAMPALAFAAAFGRLRP